MAKGNYSQKKEKKKPKKSQKGNPKTGYMPGRTYPGTIMPFPDLPGTDRT